MATRGRPAFQPTSEQRQNVEIMAGLGIPEEEICLVVRDRRDKPICRSTLRRHFAKELQTGATKLKAKVGHFMIAIIFGTRPPDGLTPIEDERVRGRLGELFLKARLGWRETDSNQHEGLKEEPPMDVQDVRRRIRGNLIGLPNPSVAENSGQPTGTCAQPCDRRAVPSELAKLEHSWSFWSRKSQGRSAGRLQHRMTGCARRCAPSSLPICCERRGK